MRTLIFVTILTVGLAPALFAQEESATPPPPVETPAAAEVPPADVGEQISPPSAPVDPNAPATFTDPENNPGEEQIAAEPAAAPEGSKTETAAAPAGSVPEEYTIQPGDTLWDLCDKFMGNPWYWPKLWSLNQYIENPHLIYPGNKIRFFLGSESAPPKLDIVGSGDKGAKAIPEAPKVAEAEEFMPVAKPTPQPTPAGLGKPEYNAFSAGESLSVKLKNISFISEKELKLAGTVSFSGDPKKNLTAGDRLYMAFREPSKINVGDQFHAVEKVKQVKDPSRWFSKLGTMVKLKAVVKVVAIHKNTIEGMIVDNSDSVERGDQLIPYVSPYRTVHPHATDKKIEGLVVESEDLKFLISNNDYVYLNLGRKQGVDDGLKLYAVRRGDGLGGSDNSLPRVVIGRLIVVETKENTSTAYVTDLTDSLSVGEIIASIVN